MRKVRDWVLNYVALRVHIQEIITVAIAKSKIILSYI